MSIDAKGDTVRTMSYAEKIASGKKAQEALLAFDTARKAGDETAMNEAQTILKENFANFGYGYFKDASQAVPPVALTFYSFRVMVMAGGYLLLLFVVILFVSYRKIKFLEKSWLHWVGIISIPVVWVCSQAGWIVAEVGRQPWVIQDLMPTTAAISDIPASSVQLTFWLFATIFTLLLVAEISIMLRYIGRTSKTDIETSKH